MRYLLLVSVFFVFACGEQKENRNTVELPLTTERPKTREVITSEDGLVEVSVGLDLEAAEHWVKYGKLAVKAWGSSNIVGLPPLEKSAKFASGKDYESDSPKMLEIMNIVQERFLNRCPSVFGNLDMDPIKLTSNETLRKDYSGLFAGLNVFFEMDEISLLYIYTDDVGYIEIPKLQNGNDIEDSRLTFEEVHGFKPWEWDYDGFDYKIGDTLSLGTYIVEQSYGDMTMAHEVGHWTVSSIINRNGRLNTETVHFSEILAMWIAGLCYTTNLEDKSGVEKLRRFLTEEFKADVEEYWPISKGFLDDALPRKIIDFQQSYLDGSFKIYGLTGLIMAYVLEDSFDPDKLMLATKEAILAMKGRQLKCRPKEEDPYCARTSLTFNQDAMPYHRRPHMFTLLEFLEELEKRIDIPPKAMKMWRKYLENLSGVEV